MDQHDDQAWQVIDQWLDRRVTKPWRTADAMRLQRAIAAALRQCAAAALEGLESDLLSAVEAIQEETKYRVWTALTRAQNDLVPLDPPPDAPQEDA